MVFAEDELHCDIFALVLIIQQIFVGACELEDISQAYFFFIHCCHCFGTFCLWCLEILELDSTYISSMDF